MLGEKDGCREGRGGLLLCCKQVRAPRVRAEPEKEPFCGASMSRCCTGWVHVHPPFASALAGHHLEGAAVGVGFQLVLCSCLPTGLRLQSRKSNEDLYHIAV